MIKVHPLMPDEWLRFSEHAHRIAFCTHLESQKQRIDFALLATRGEDPLGYVACREFDADTLYWQFGGTFPGARETSLSYSVYMAGIDFCRGKYKRITTLISNQNKVMLKFAAKAGFIIHGVRAVEGEVLLEHILEFKKE